MADLKLFFFMTVIAGIITLLVWEMEKEEFKKVYHKIKGDGNLQGVVPQFNKTELGGFY